ncbi:transcriptional regulator [Longispora fulva]|uniref:Putative ArsR family transcriptional regulator n=1 Tax=Longispora fulva TaxID=619741 RepID=A0A8J7KJL2_9ACTN|nr:helix-turn-helix domain-containing protein [Longispora fulva]MBG6136999.1 putative ArsR family transcriptional regulator [Longispora fulva]GIG61648.1 transcriptional regulator [Longispora fulva]
MSELPHRQVSDPAELRAFAHPLRIRLIEELLADGPATASQLADRVGESPANCSWHLRLLHRYGYVEEAEGGTGRQRPWQMVLTSRSWCGDHDDPELAMAGDEATRFLTRRELDALEAWNARRRTEPAAWRDAGFTNQSLAWLTPEELADLGRQIGELLVMNAERFRDRSTRPEGARLIRLMAWGVPATPPMEK